MLPLFISPILLAFDFTVSNWSKKINIGAEPTNCDKHKWLFKRFASFFPLRILGNFSFEFASCSSSIVRSTGRKFLNLKNRWMHQKKWGQLVPTMTKKKRFQDFLAVFALPNWLFILCEYDIFDGCSTNYRFRNVYICLS